MPKLLLLFLGVATFVGVLYLITLGAERLTVYLKRKLHKTNLDNVVFHYQFVELRKHLNE